ncbi:MAG: hypothetical protein K6A72_03545 [Lachnospiraceae bacterium]|nr:hypothetical protein [Lachnospiraceae bacterium]
MAKEFVALSDKDTKELRNSLKLPVTKELVYWKKDSDCEWRSFSVVDYEVIATYEPSGSMSLMISLADGNKVRILSDYFSEMQKSSFLSDISKASE